MLRPYRQGCARRRRRQPTFAMAALKGHSKTHPAALILYYLLLLAQFLLCLLEIVRLSLAGLGVCSLPVTLLSLVGASCSRDSKKDRHLQGDKFMIVGCAAVTNSVKIVQVVKEGTDARKGSK